MKDFSPFYPSPYQIKNSWVRQRYKIFLFLIRRFHFEDSFESIFNKRQITNPLKFFSDKVNCEEGYFNRLCGWINYPNLRDVLKTLEIINHYILWLLEQNEYQKPKFFDYSCYQLILLYGEHNFSDDFHNEHITPSLVKMIFDVAEEFKKPKNENILIKENVLPVILKKMNYKL